MRIGIDARLWNQTGVGRYIRNLVLNLHDIDKTNNYILFVRKIDFEEIQKQIVNSNWKIVNVNIKWHSLEEQINFPKILEKQKLELIHFPYFSVPVRYKGPFIVTIHDLIMDHFPSGNASTLPTPFYYLKYLAYKYILKQAAKKAKGIIVPSFATKDEVVAHLGVNSDKIVVTYEAANDKFSVVNNRQLVINKKYDKYFLYVGNAYPHKNLDRLIKAFIEFKDIRPKTENIKLLLVGNKDYFYQKLEQKYISDNIIYFGFASDDDLLNLYKNALAVVQPSLMEGFGLTVLEAMTNKSLVVCSDIPSLREIAGENALYFEPNNVGEIKKNLDWVVANPKLKESIVEKAYLHSQNFSWVTMATKTLEVYKNAL